MANGSKTQSFRVTANVSEWHSVIDSIADEMQGAARPAARAGSQVLYEQVKANVAAIPKKTGNLADSIYQAFSPENSRTNGRTKADGRQIWPVSSYNVSWRTAKYAGEKGTQQGGLTRAPHGHLIEFGHLARYVNYIDKKGEWKTAIRPEMRGKKKPKRRASIAEKDAYYVLRKTPLQVAATPFVAPAAAKFEEAYQAMAAAYVAELAAKGIVK